MASLLERDAVGAVTREQIQDLYDRYYDVLDAVQLEDWPNFFAKECVYRIISRENYEADYRLATVGAESRGMLMDRVTGLIRTQVFAPRYYRRFPGPIRIYPVEGSHIPVEHNLLIVQTLINKQSDIVLSGRCHDRLAIENGELLIKQRQVVFDSEMIPNSLIYPL